MSGSNEEAAHAAAHSGLFYREAAPAWMVHATGWGSVTSNDNNTDEAEQRWRAVPAEPRLEVQHPD